MKRHIPGLHGDSPNTPSILEGVFLVRVDRIFYRWHPERPFYVLRLTILEPREHQGRSLNGRLYCTPKALWKLRWFLRDFGYDPDLLGRDEVGRKGAPRPSRNRADFPHHPERPLVPQSRRVCSSQ